MRHGGEINHECGGPKIVNCSLFGLCACGQHRFLKLGDGTLPIRLAEWEKSNPGGYQIGRIALQEGGQRQFSRNALPCRTNSKNDSQGRLNMAFAEYFRKPVQYAIGPYLT